MPPPNPTTHYSYPLNFTHFSSLFWPALSVLSFIFSLFILLKHTHTHPPASTPKHTISPSFFRQDHRKNTYELQSIFIILFEVKVQIFFDGYYVLVWGYFTQALIMLFMWFKSFGNDIHVFICMGFGLGGCIWWVSSWFLQWWLSKACCGENLEVLSYNMW